MSARAVLDENIIGALFWGGSAPLQNRGVEWGEYGEGCSLPNRLGGLGELPLRGLSGDLIGNAFGVF